MNERTSSSLADVQPSLLPVEPQRPEVTPALDKAQWAQAMVPVETGSSVSESDSRVMVSGPRPSVETFLMMAGVQVAAVLEVFTPLADTAKLRKNFDRLSKSWLKESRHLSSATQKAMLPSYQEIIGLGPAAVPVILERLEKEPTQWFWALRAITRADPIPDEHVGRVKEMANDWIEWGRKNGVHA